MGLGPATELNGVKVRDRICMVYGAYTLFVIREVEYKGQGQSFDLIRETYVHGLMDGEATDESFLEERDIVLR